MAEPTTSSSAVRGSRGARSRGSHKPRGGFGKSVRARGRGGRGRPAQFGTRLLLEGEAPLTPEEEEAAEEERKKYFRRQLGTNADRYKEQEPELDSDGEPIVEPEVDISTLLERQKLGEESAPVYEAPEDDDDVDHSIAPSIGSRSHTQASAQTRKGKVQEVEWDAGLEELKREKAAFEATRDLKSRFKAKPERLQNKPIVPKAKDQGLGSDYVNAPPLPTDTQAPKGEKEQMEEFLDDLLN
ncbi:hypothetical protein HDZ31DRAFT_48461 [Schizophyllum fasciatum]